jgi:arylformamidase
MMADLTPEYCDRHYNFMSPEMIGALLEALGQRSKLARASVRGDLNVRYGPGENETLDLFHPREASAALLVFIHGGYWAFADKDQFSYPAAGFLQSGVSFAAINYALVPRVTIEEQIEQCRRAIAFLHGNSQAYGLDAERLFVSGHSAGGHLASMVMLTDWPSWRPGLPVTLLKGGLTISGLHDLEAIRRTPALNAVLRLDQERTAALSPARYPPAPGVPLYTAVGGRENVEFQRQTTLLNQSWQSVLKRSLVMPDEDHFSILDRFGDGRSEIFRMTTGMMGLAAREQ